MAFHFRTLLVAIGLFAGMLVLMELGARWARRRSSGDPQASRSGTAPAEGAVFALLGLLIAFTFAGALDRFERRRSLIVDESNAIGTAWLRLDLLPGDARTEIRQGFREYLDARLGFYEALPDIPGAHSLAAQAKIAQAAEIQQRMWVRAQSASRTEAPPVSMLLLPAMNEMFDLASTRVAALENHPPEFLFYLLVFMALACALLAGFAMSPSKFGHWTHRLAFSAVVSLTVYAIRDLEYPRQGLLRVDRFDRPLYELRASMDESGK